MIREGLSTTFVCPRQHGHGRRPRRDRDRAARIAERRWSGSPRRRCPYAADPRPPIERVRARYGCDRFTATVLANRFGYIVEHICGRVLTAAFSPILRDFYDFAATLAGPPARLPDAGDERQHRPVHRDDDRLGPQHRRGVRPRAPRAGRRDRRQRPLPQRHARQRPAVLPPGVPWRARSPASST